MNDDDLVIYKYVQLEAISGILNKTDVSFFRNVCRWYSREFNTPLHDVIGGKYVTWDQVLLHYYEDQMNKVSHNELFDVMITSHIPELALEHEEDNEKFARDLVSEQKKTLEKKKAKDQVKENTFKPVKISFEDEEV